MGLEAIPRTQVGEAVYTRLLANIREGVWKSGDKLPAENTLCKQLNVSRVSVRSAIQSLRTLGLVETIHGKGTYVTCINSADFSHMERRLDLTEKEFSELNELREAIEPKALDIIANNRDSVDFTPITQAYQGMRAALEKRDVEDYTRQDYLFHLMIVNATGNSLFLQIVRIFQTQLYKYLQELNKLTFLDQECYEELLRRNVEQSDNHTLIYQYLIGERQEDSLALTQAITRCNQARYTQWLST